MVTIIDGFISFPSSLTLAELHNAHNSSLRTLWLHAVVGDKIAPESHQLKSRPGGLQTFECSSIGDQIAFVSNTIAKNGRSLRRLRLRLVQEATACFDYTSNTEDDELQRSNVGIELVMIGVPNLINNRDQSMGSNAEFSVGLDLETLEVVANSSHISYAIRKNGTGETFDCCLLRIAPLPGLECRN